MQKEKLESENIKGRNVDLYFYTERTKLRQLNAHSNSIFVMDSSRYGFTTLYCNIGKHSRNPKI